jgi:hypothetical protein
VRSVVAWSFVMLAATGCGSTDPSVPTSPAAEGVLPAQPPIGTMAQLLGPWSRTPFRLDPALAAAVDRTCRADMDTFPIGIPLVVFDARGDGFTQVYYAGQNGSFAVCNGIAIRPNGPPIGMGGGSTGNQAADVSRPLAPFDIVQTEVSSEGRPVHRSFVGGRTGAGIVRVLIVLPGQQPVVASFMNHWFAAWFPGAWPPGWKIVGLDATGVEVAQIDGG